MTIYNFYDFYDIFKDIIIIPLDLVGKLNNNNSEFENFDYLLSRFSLNYISQEYDEADDRMMLN